MTRPLKLGLALLVGLGVGVSVGMLSARRTIGVSSGLMAQWAAVGTYVQLADFQYQYAAEPHARAALADFVSFAEKLRATGQMTDPNALAVFVARTYARLAVLDRHSGDTDGYQSDLVPRLSRTKGIGLSKQLRRGRGATCESTRFSSVNEPKFSMPIC
jgi:hypothetical protein